MADALNDSPAEVGTRRLSDEGRHVPPTNLRFDQLPLASTLPVAMDGDNGCGTR